MSIKMKKISRTLHHVAIATACAVAAIATPTFAHHSFAMFDMKRTVTLKDVTVVQFKWGNPHVFLIVTDGKTRYTLEAGSPSNMRQAGWKFNSLQGGEKIDVVMNPLRNGKPGGSFITVKLADGRILGGANE
jgi:hypothetical protein